MKDLNVYFFGRPRKKNQENDFHEIFLELHFEINGTCMHSNLSQEISKNSWDQIKVLSL